MKGLKLIFVGSFATLAALPIFAMESPALTADGESIEEISVVGQRTILALRLQMETAEDDVHRLYNSLNSDDSYDIICKMVDRYYSRVQDKQCKPRFAWDALATEGQAFSRQLQGEIQTQNAPANFDMARLEPAMKEQFIEALRNSPELFDAVVKHAQLMEKLQQAKATYFGEEQ